MNYHWPIPAKERALGRELQRVRAERDHYQENIYAAKHRLLQLTSAGVLDPVSSRELYELLNREETDDEHA